MGYLQYPKIPVAWFFWFKMDEIDGSLFNFDSNHNMKQGLKNCDVEYPNIGLLQEYSIYLFLQMVAWVNSNPSHLRGQKQANVSQKTGRIE